MDRRQVIKAVVASAGTFYAMEESSFALPIRGITNKGGRLVQPIQLTIAHAGKDATLVMRADHLGIERRVRSSGTHTFNVYVDPVEMATHVFVDYEIAGKTRSTEVRLEPVHKIQVFILPHSHNDLGYTDLQSNIEANECFSGFDGARLKVG